MDERVGEAGPQRPLVAWICKLGEAMAKPAPKHSFDAPRGVDLAAPS
jgi:hypothetical protein